MLSIFHANGWQILYHWFRFSLRKINRFVQPFFKVNIIVRNHPGYGDLIQFFMSYKNKVANTFKVSKRECYARNKKWLFTFWKISNFRFIAIQQRKLLHDVFSYQIAYLKNCITAFKNVAIVIKNNNLAFAVNVFHISKFWFFERMAHSVNQPLLFETFH